jgi:hypothetical protein
MFAGYRIVDRIILDDIADSKTICHDWTKAKRPREGSHSWTWTKHFDSKSFHGTDSKSGSLAGWQYAGANRCLSAPFPERIRSHIECEPVALLQGRHLLKVGRFAIKR